jgi:hypothetical protein
MFDLDEAFHALEGLDSQGRKALMLAGKLWEEIYRDEHQHVPTPLTRRYLTELSERTEEIRVLRERLDVVLDSREEAELRAEQAESLLEKARAWATSWGLDTKLDLTLAHWRPHCRRQPRSFVHEERIDLLEEEVRRRQRESKAAREAQFVAIDRMQHERARTKAAEKERDNAWAEVGRLRAQLNF